MICAAINPAVLTPSIRLNTQSISVTAGFRKPPETLSVTVRATAMAHPCARAMAIKPNVGLPLNAGSRTMHALPQKD